MKTAANPATAMLFMDWLLEEGQEVIVDLESLTPAIVEGGDALADVELVPGRQSTGCSRRATSGARSTTSCSPAARSIAD